MKVNSKNNKKEKFEIPGQGLYMYAESIEEARKVLTDEVLRVPYIKIPLNNSLLLPFTIIFESEIL